jgi:hypothetical protein
MDFKINVKTLILIVGIACTLGGFYYTTNLRLNLLEEENKALQSKISDVHSETVRLDNRLNRLKKRIGKK